MAEKFLRLIEERGLLEPEAVEELRQQVRQLDGKISPEAIAKTLVERGMLTRFQATKLIAELTERVEQKKEDRAAKRKVAVPRTSNDELELAEEELEAVIEDEPPARPARQPATAAPRPVQSAPVPPAAQMPGQMPVPGVFHAQMPYPGQVAGLTPLPTAGLTPLPGAALGPDLGAFAGQPAVLNAGQPGMGFGAEALPSSRPAGASTTKAVARRSWRQTWLLVLGGSLALLAVSFVALSASFIRGNAITFFQAADDAYNKQAYSEAMGLYDKYLGKFPRDANASKARVRRGLAEMRVALGGPPERCVEVIKSQLPKIENEAAFADDGRAELAGVIVEAAEGISRKAREAKTVSEKQKLLESADAAQELIKNPSYMPSSQIKVRQPRLQKIQENIEIATRDIQRSERLATTLKQVEDKLGANDTIGAQALLKVLVDEYPGLASNDSVRETSLRISQKNRELVRVTEQAFPVTNTEPELPADYRRVVLADREGGAAVGVENQVVFVLAGGGVYGLEAASGRALWQRPVGYETTIRPVPLGPQPGADAIVADSRKHEVMRIQATTGKLVWSTSIGEPFLEPAVAHRRIVITTRSGKVFQLDPESGASDRFTQLPQNLGVQAAFDATRPRMYQVGDHSSVYVLSASTHECDEVLFIGHKPGAVEVNPVMCAGLLFVADNAGADFSLVHVLKSGVDGLALEVAQPPFRLKGNIVTPPVVFGRHVVFLTNLRGIHLYEVDPNGKVPATLIAEQIASEKTSILSHGVVVDDTRLFIVDNRLAHFELQLTKSQMVRKWTAFEGDDFVAPLQRVGGVIVHQRRMRQSGGITVTASNADDGRPIWTTHLGQPALQVAVDAQKAQILSVSSGGLLYAIAPNQFNGCVDQAADRGGPALSFDQATSLPDGRWVFLHSARPDQLLICDPKQTAGRMRVVPMKLSGAPTALAQPFANGILLALDSGEVVVLDPDKGLPAVQPFQPPVDATAKIKWCRPAILKSGREFVIADHQQNIYRVGMKSGTPPSLMQLKAGGLGGPVGSQIAAVGDLVFVPLRLATADTIVAVQTSDLKTVKEIPLSGRVTWGPETVGEVALVVTDQEGLICLNDKGEQLWQSPLQNAAVSGPPLLVEQQLILTTTRGTILRIAAASGQEVARGELGQPLGRGALAFNGRLLLTGTDGALHLIRIPEAK